LAAPELLAATEKKSEHTLSLFVNNKPGVLVRVALTFARRGYNIESLVVSPAASGEFSRMTITCSGEPETLGQIIRQLQKLVDVVRAIDHSSDESYETELALIKVACALDQRTEILQIAEHFHAKVVDYGSESLMLRIYGSSEKLDAFIALVRPYGLRELVRSGKILMARGLQET
jgi:acetolactate synthase I/III small subunit